MRGVKQPRSVSYCPAGGDVVSFPGFGPPSWAGSLHHQPTQKILEFYEFVYAQREQVLAVSARPGPICEGLFPLFIGDIGL